MLLLRRSPRTSIVTRARLVRKVEDGLAGRVAGAHDHDVLARALRRLAPAGSVVDAVADQVVDAVKVEPCPVHPRRREYDRGGHLRAVVDEQPDGLVKTVHPATA